ncbi:gamma-glutamyltransferase 1 . Threonine peptidase. MEROPS family T03 [Alteromonadaceae bacterium Bs31]|nr:gamma-glutamyltransferase 1 . Threonine peptidase. MEROPS family T03 [Alteromonadaceae bacterium Bs31]
MNVEARLLTGLTLLSLAVFSFAGAYQPPTYNFEDAAQITHDGKGAIASGNSIATQLGLDAFARGGNAIDAAAAVAFGLGVVDSANSGIGGGCFILIHWADGTIEAIDGREMAPHKATKDLFLVKGKYEPQLSKTGALAIGVPGSVAALEYIVQKGGKLKWKDAILPAATIAEKGYVVGDYYSKRFSRYSEQLSLFPETAKIFLNEKGAAWAPEHVLKQKDLASTYRKIAKKGSAYFYKGDFAEKVESWMKQNGGIVSAEDFERYQTLVRQPVKTSFKGYTILGFPPPSSGGTHVGQILNILENYPLNKLSSVDRYHYTIEAMKLAFADRAFWMGDADFVDVPTGLVDKSYALSLGKTINPLKANEVKGHGTPPDAATKIFNRHTTHLTVADKEGNWVAITTTINTGFGSKVVIPGTGVLMNNQMDDFTGKAGSANIAGLVGYDANLVEARKRPLSSMSPTIVLKEGKPVLAVGAAGGPTIITQVVQTLLNTLALDMPLEQAMAEPRVHNQWRPERTLVDAFIDAGLRKKLSDRGHTLVDWPAFGGTQAISLEDGKFIPVTEPRLKARMDF